VSPRRKAHECLDLRYGAQTTYTYDSASQMTNIMHQLTATSSQINKADYLYNQVGNRTSLTDEEVRRRSGMIRWIG
jgi:YD repeat-containing protein